MQTEGLEVCCTDRDVGTLGRLVGRVYCIKVRNALVGPAYLDFLVQGPLYMDHGTQHLRVVFYFIDIR
jgi:hypothetical protein